MVYFNCKQEADFLCQKAGLLVSDEEQTVSCLHAERSPYYLEKEMPRWNNPNCGFQKGHPQYRKDCIKGLHFSPKTEFKKGNKYRFQIGHTIHTGKFAENSCTWKGGRIKHSSGYIRIYIPKHPFADKQGYMFEHRLVIEKQLNRYLTFKEIVHHINGIKDDNRIENLMLFKHKSAHKKFHTIQRGMQKGEILFDGRELKNKPLTKPILCATLSN